MIEKFFANTKQQPLDQHLFSVGFVAYLLIKKLLNDDKLATAAFVAGGLHDIGKLDPEFQAWLLGTINKDLISEQPEDGLHIEKGQFTFDKHARHNEISLFLYHLLDDEGFKDINRRNKDLIKHVIYWHHAKPIRKNEFTSLDFIQKKLSKSIGGASLKCFYNEVKTTISLVNKLSANYNVDESINLTGFMNDVEEDKLYGLDKIKLPDYKSYLLSNDVIKDYVSNVNENAKKSIVRAAVISADRLVSSLSKEQLAEHIEQRKLDKLLDHLIKKDSTLKIDIEKCLQGFDSAYPESRRNNQQHEAAKKLASVKGVAVLNGPAGCGKTKIALEWALNSAVKKIIWVCPRVQVCEGLFHDLTSNEYLPNTRIEICTGQLKFVKKNGFSVTTPEGEEFSGDIVLTTIDQIINTLITHSRVTSLIDFMETHIVFDEYHEYINMPAFNLLFAELVQCKKLQGEYARTLLVSATPNYFFIKEMFEIDKDDVIGIDSFNQRKYQISFKVFDETKHDETNPLFALQANNSIVISNTATTAQLSFIANMNKENSILFHSKFKQLDKTILFNKIFDSFKQQGSLAYDVLRSGPVVQASLNITCKNMVTEFTYAENWLQRLGRLDRFGENFGVNQYVIAIPQAIAENKGIKGGCAKFLNYMNSFLSAKAWYQFLLDNGAQSKILTIADFYQFYEKFYESCAGKTAVENDLMAALKFSAQVIENKVHDPVCFPKKKSTSNQKKLKKSSLRGDSRFVQMAVCEISNEGKFLFPNKYACDELNDLFTMSVNEIEGYDPTSDKNMISFMYQKHHKILSAKHQKKHSQEYKYFMLKNEAIDPEFPIYVSYTKDDLDLCNDKPHVHAIYYVVSTTQPIGAISISKLNIQSNIEE